MKCRPAHLSKNKGRESPPSFHKSDHHPFTQRCRLPAIQPGSCIDMETENASRITGLRNPFNAGSAKSLSSATQRHRRGIAGSKAEREPGRESARYSMGFCLISNMVAPVYCVFDNNAWATGDHCFGYWFRRLRWVALSQYRGGRQEHQKTDS